MTSRYLPFLVRQFPYQEGLREQGYRHLIQTAKRICPDLEIGLCLETHEMFETFSQQVAMGQCNCVL
jgi:hypothetical protein